MITLQEFEAALKSALQTALPEGTDVAEYQGEIDPETLTAETIALPAVRFALALGENERRGNNGFYYTVTETLFIFAHGLYEGVDTGVYNIMDTVFETLQDKNLGLQIEDIDVGPHESVYQDSSVCIYAVSIKTKLPR